MIFDSGVTVRPKRIHGALMHAFQKQDLNLALVERGFIHELG
jgi:hypothetical protein